MMSFGEVVTLVASLLLIAGMLTVYHWEFICQKIKSLRKVLHRYRQS